MDKYIWLDTAFAFSISVAHQKDEFDRINKELDRADKEMTRSLLESLVALATELERPLEVRFNPRTELLISPLRHEGKKPHISSAAYSLAMGKRIDGLERKLAKMRRSENRPNVAIVDEASIAVNPPRSQKLDELRFQLRSIISSAREEISKIDTALESRGAANNISPTKVAPRKLRVFLEDPLVGTEFTDSKGRKCSVRTAEEGIRYTQANHKVKKVGETIYYSVVCVEESGRTLYRTFSKERLMRTLTKLGVTK